MHSATFSNPTIAAKPWYRHVWPWLLMLGPFLVVVGGAHAAWLAFSQQDALVVDDYYKEGKAINQDLRRDRVAAQLKLAGDLRYDAARGVLLGTLASDGKPYRGELTVRLVHSTQPDKDLRLQVTPDDSGAFTAAVPMLEMARWKVIVEGQQRDWRLVAGWAWPREKQVRIEADRL